MRSQIKLAPVTVPPVAVEAEFRSVLLDASQESIATACGLSCHTTISERLGKGIRKGYLASFSAEHLLRIGAGSGAIQAAVLAYWQQQNTSRATAASLTDEVRAEISEDAALIGRCNSALADGKLTRSEKADLVLALQKSIDHRMQLVAHLRASMQEESRHG